MENFYLGMWSGVWRLSGKYWCSHSAGTPHDQSVNFFPWGSSLKHSNLNLVTNTIRVTPQMIFRFYITWFHFSAFTVLCITGNIHSPVIFRKTYLDLIFHKQWHTAIVWTENLQKYVWSFIYRIFFFFLRYSVLSFRIRAAVCRNTLHYICGHRFTLDRQWTRLILRIIHAWILNLCQE